MGKHDLRLTLFKRGQMQSSQKLQLTTTDDVDEAFGILLNRFGYRPAQPRSLPLNAAPESNKINDFETAMFYGLAIVAYAALIVGIPTLGYYLSSD